MRGAVPYCGIYSTDLWVPSKYSALGCNFSITKISTILLIIWKITVLDPFQILVPLKNITDCYNSCQTASKPLVDAVSQVSVQHLSGFADHTLPGVSLLSVTAVTCGWQCQPLPTAHTLSEWPVVGGASKGLLINRAVHLVDLPERKHAQLLFSPPPHPYKFYYSYQGLFFLMH